MNIPIKKLMIQVLLLRILITYGQGHSIEYIMTYKPSLENNKKNSQLYFLDILNNESLFRSEKSRDSDSIQNKTGYSGSGSTIFNDYFYIKKNMNNNSVYKLISVPLSTDKFNIKMTKPLNWKLSSDTKVIEKFRCQKAEVEYGGRHWTAWFTEEIGIPEGPYIFNNLPGLIIQISDQNKEYVFQLIKIKKYYHKELYTTKMGKEITQNEYEKIQIDYYNDPFAFVKSQNLKTVTDDGMGGTKKLDFREMTQAIRERIRENNNPIEINHNIEYKP